MYCPPEFLNVYAYQVAHVIKADPYVDPMVFSTKAIVTFIDKLASKVITFLGVSEKKYYELGIYLFIGQDII